MRSRATLAAGRLKKASGTTPVLRIEAIISTTPAPIAQLDDHRRMIARALVSAHLRVNATRFQPLSDIRAEQ